MISKIKVYFKDLKLFNWKLWVALCALSLVPAIYQTIRTFLLSTTTSANGIDIVGQMEWYDLIDETLKAFLIVPLYFILNKFFTKSKEDFNKVIFKSLVVVFVLYVLFNVGVLIYGYNLIKFMNPETTDVSAVKKYLGLETLAFMIGIIPSFINVAFVTIGKSKNVYIFLVIQAVLGIISDFIFIPQIGVNGIAISNIVTNSILAIASIVILCLEGYMKISWFNKNDGSIAIDWLKTGLFSGTQQFIDNIIYALMVARMVNMVAEQGNYWVANNFIWGWMLIPVSTMAEIIKRDCQSEYKDLKQSNYYMLSIFIFLFWAVTIPLWIPFFKGVEQLENYQDIFLITIKLAPFYIAYTLCIIPDSIFIGYGKTYYNAINSVLVNFVYYGIWFALYKSNAIAFSINTIIMMFGFGMVFHEAISIVEERLFFRRIQMKEINN